MVDMKVKYFLNTGTEREQGRLLGGGEKRNEP